MGISGYICTGCFVIAFDRDSMQTFRIIASVVQMYMYVHVAPKQPGIIIVFSLSLQSHLHLMLCIFVCGCGDSLGLEKNPYNMFSTCSLTNTMSCFRACITSGKWMCLLSRF